MRQIVKSIVKSFQNSGKKHLLITGKRGSGKTTFMRRIQEQLSLENEQFSGITTYAVPRKYVILKENGTDREAVIGRYDKRQGDCSGNQMCLVFEGFGQLGIPALERAMQMKQEWVSIDEIGYLESGALEFQNIIRKVFEKKRVLAVLRKQELSFLEELKGREDVYLVDLDEIQKNIGCVIMASGLGRRFGGNKLLAEFQGKTLLQHTLDMTADVFSKRVVVTRSREVEAICIQQKVDVLFHTFPNRNDTVRLGVNFLKDMESIVFCPCDQPFLKRESLQKMKNAFCMEEQSIFRLAYQEKQGTPILFDRLHFGELCSLPEKCGGSYLVKTYPEKVRLVSASSEMELYDIDTKEDLDYCNIWKKKNFS